MGWFSKRQSSIIMESGAVNPDAQARNSTGAVSLADAHQALQLGPDQTLHDDVIWRVRSTNCHKLQGNQFWIGYIKPKGNKAALFVSNKQVGTIEPQGMPSVVKILKAYGGKQARCVISNPSQKSWNVYVNMA
jgi:hypothetical protein